MRIKGQGHSLTLVKGHSDFKVKCLSFGLYTQVSYSGPLGPLVFEYVGYKGRWIGHRGKVGRSEGYVVGRYIVGDRLVGRKERYVGRKEGM